VHDPGDELDGEGLDHVGDVDGPGSDTPAPERTHLPPVPGPSGAQSPTPSERRAILGTVSAAHGHLTADWLERQIDGDANARATRELGGIVREGDLAITTAVREGDLSITTAVREGDGRIVDAMHEGDKGIIEAIGKQGRLMVWSNLVALAIVAALAGVTSAMEFGGWGFTAGPEKVETSTDHVAEPKHDHELWHGNNDDDVDAEPDVGPMLDTGAVID
jgi:hypothetical protein